MLRIRLFRVGKKNQPAFKIVVTERKNPPSGGNFIEQVGFWNPLTKEKVLKEDRIKYWISVGAQPSDTVHNMLVDVGITKGKKKKHKKAKKEKGKVSEEKEDVEEVAGGAEESKEESKEGEKQSETKEDQKEEEPSEEKDEPDQNKKEEEEK